MPNPKTSYNPNFKLPNLTEDPFARALQKASNF